MSMRVISRPFLRRLLMVSSMAEAPTEEPSAKRFAGTTDAERAELVADAIPDNTKRATKAWISALDEYCKESSKPLIDFSEIDSPTLANCLEGFYADARKKNGEKYRRNSLMAARGAFNRHLQTFQPAKNIFKDPDFKTANKVLDGVLKAKKRDGEEPTVQHKSALSDMDLDRMDEYFDDVLECADPRKLSYYVWFTVTTHFCLRGGEVQCKLKKADLVFQTVDGREVIQLHTDFMSKNHSGGTTGSSFNTAGTIADDKQIKAIKLYLSHLHPQCDRLFQRAKTLPGMAMADASASCWYMNVPLSHNLLSNMMKRLSVDAQLSQSYTNHCLRATSISLMKKSGIEDRKIMAISGHKNVQSLQAYDRPTSTDSALAAAAAIDRKPTNSVAVASSKHGATFDFSSCNAENIPPRCASAAFPASTVFSGSTLNNVTFNIVPSPPPKKRLSLKLKKKEKKNKEVSTEVQELVRES